MPVWQPDLSSLVDRVAAAVGDATSTIDAAELQTGGCHEYEEARSSLREAGEHLAVAMFAEAAPEDAYLEAVCRAWEAIAAAQDSIARARALAAPAVAQRAWAIETRAHAQQQAVIARARADRLRLSRQKPRGTSLGEN
jgi:hypothetical protein